MFDINKINIYNFHRFKNKDIIFYSRNSNKYKYILTIEDVRNALNRDIKNNKISSDIYDYFDEKMKLKTYILNVKKNKYYQTKRLYENIMRKKYIKRLLFNDFNKKLSNNHINNIDKSFLSINTFLKNDQIKELLNDDIEIYLTSSLLCRLKN